MKSIISTLAVQILNSTYIRLYPGLSAVPRRLLSRESSDRDEPDVMEALRDLEDDDDPKWKQKSDALLQKLSPDDKRINPKDVVAGLPRGINYREKYHKRWQHRKLDTFDVQKVQRILKEALRPEGDCNKHYTETGTEDFSRLESDKPLKKFPDPYSKKRKMCILCEHNIDVDYKNVRLLSQFVSSRTGMIYSRKTTGLCIPMQRHVTNQIKTARRFGFMPYMNKKMEYLDDPDVFQTE